METHKQITAKIHGGYWLNKLEMNAQKAIFHQWEQLEKSGCIDNFRLQAGRKEGFREGWFFADSDAYKWLDAAARCYARFPSDRLKSLMNAFIELIGAAQDPDGYLYTYNQIHFPGTRWVNLQIEHELYCHGHLIEAGVSHYKATGERKLIDLTIRTADLLVKTFMWAKPEMTPGHQEIEIALERLYEATNLQAYLDLAEHFLEQRGRIPFFPSLILRENTQTDRRAAQRSRARDAYKEAHPGYQAGHLPPGNLSVKPPWIQARFMLSGLSGKYMQQHRPIREQMEPVGHSVRYGYLQTATARLHRLNGDPSLLPALMRSWDHMVQKRMAVTGGIGSLPVIEGFGRDFELNPKTGYNETCAALACMFWNWEMTQITGKAQFADLFEWQLYNASGVGMGLEGDSYLYNNPLTCTGGVTRRPWYAVPCCPSNISRTWADLGDYLLTAKPKEIWLHQYVSCRSSAPVGDGVHMAVESGLPYSGQVSIELAPERPAQFTIHCRIPSWTTTYRISINGKSFTLESPKLTGIPTASGYSPYASHYLPITRTWEPGDRVDIEFDLPIQIRRTDPRVKHTRHKISLTRGPLVYCLEEIDHPGMDIQSIRIEPSSLATNERPDLLNGTWVIDGKTVQGKPFMAIPYHLWGNRGASAMTVYLSS